MISSCKKENNETSGTGKIILIGNAPATADTIDAYSNSVLNVRLIGGTSSKYVLKITGGFYFPRYDTGYSADFNINTGLLWSEAGNYNARFEFYGGRADQSFKQIIEEGKLTCGRDVIISFYGYYGMPSPVFKEKNGTLNGTVNDSLQFMKVMSVERYFTGANVRVLIDSVTGCGTFTFTDKGYVGERAWYEFQGYSANDSGILFRTSSAEIIREMELTPHQITKDNEGRPLLRWNKNRYWQNFGSYRIRAGRNDYNAGTVLKEITDINDTVDNNLDLGFPGNVYVTVTHLPKINAEYITSGLEVTDYGYRTLYSPGLPFPPFYTMGSPKGTDIYHQLEYDEFLIRTSTLTYQKVDSIYCPNGSFAISANDKYVVTRGGSYFNIYNVITKEDSKIPIIQFVPPANLGKFAVSDNGIMAVMNEFDTIVIRDIINNVLVCKMPISTSFWGPCMISPTGIYVCYSPGSGYLIYKINGSSYTKVFSMNGVILHLPVFIPDEPDKVLLIKRETLDIYNLATGVTESSFPYQGTFVRADFNSNLVMTDDTYFYRFFDIHTGNLVKKITQNIDFANPAPDALHNYTIFNGSGKRMTIIPDR